MTRRIATGSLFVALLGALVVGCGDEDRSSGDATRAQPPTSPTSTSTPAATPALPPDWQRFETDVIAISAPDRYVGGDPGDDQTLDAIRALGAKCVAAADLIEQFRDGYDFAAVDRNTCATTSVRTVQVLASPSSTLTPSEFAEEFVRQLGDRGSLLDFREGSIGGVSAALMHVRRQFGEAATIQAIYAVRAARSWYVVAAAAEEANFAAAESGFDEIAATFRVK